MLLDALWRKHGGLRKCAKLCGVPEYQLNAWRARGGVPWKYVLQVSVALKVPRTVLNFQKIFGLVDEGDWVTMVKACKLDLASEKKILKMKVPR